MSSRSEAVRHLAAATILLALLGCDAASRNASPAPAATAKETAGQASPLRPSRTGYAQVGDARIHYAIYGALNKGQTPLVVLHGSLMSGEAMAPLVAPLAATRPVITVDARGHGRTGDVPGPIRYQQMADDTAAVIRSLGIRTADVLGYSMGGTTALLLASRHPGLVGKQVIVSAPATRSGWYPKVQASFEQWKPELFAGTPVEREYKELSATPKAFPAVIDKLRELEKSDYDVAAAALRAIPGKTLIVVGDSDGVDLAHAVQLFVDRGGPDPDAATKGFISKAPRARLAILPATSHVGIMNEGEAIARLAVPFLDDRPPAPPSGFFEGMDRPAPASGGPGNRR